MECIHIHKTRPYIQVSESSEDSAVSWLGSIGWNKPRPAISHSTIYSSVIAEYPDPAPCNTPFLGSCIYIHVLHIVIFHQNKVWCNTNSEQLLSFFTVFIPTSGMKRVQRAKNLPDPSSFQPSSQENPHPSCRWKVHVYLW